MSSPTGEAAAASPLIDALREAAERAPAVYHTPGHKRGRWTGRRLGQAEAGRFWAWDGGDAVWAPGYHHRIGRLVDELAARCARTWGADRSWLLWNGATAGVLAMVAACAGPGQPVILPRRAHRSALAALVLSGARPLFVEEPLLAGWELPLPPGPAEVAAVPGGPGSAPVLAVSPTYYGILPDLAALARVAAPHPLLVDEAHGAHLAFAAHLPRGLACGACLVTHGTHKTLCAPTQTGLLHWARPPRPAEARRWPQPERVAAFLSMVQSTSPHPLLLAALEDLEQTLREEGQQRVARALEAARLAREAVEAQGPFRCLRPGDVPAPWRLDESRLVVDLRGAGISGFAAQTFLMEQANVWPEMADARHLVFIFTGADDPGSARRLGEAFRALYRARHQLASAPAEGERLSVRLPAPGPAELTPQQALAARRRWVRWEQAVGEVAADLVTPYPPGAPLVVPGERVSSELAAWARAAARAGAELRGWMGECGEGLWVVGR